MRWLLLCFATACWSQSSSTTQPIQPVQKPKIKDIVQPVKIEKIEDGEVGGVMGGDPCNDPNGVMGGQVGGVVGGAPPPPPPPPPAPPTNIPPTMLEGNRIAGEKAIVPDDMTKVEIQQAGKDKLVGSWKLCVTPTGAVSSVYQLKTTGFPRYDTKIETEMRTNWRYRPYLVNGKAVPVCTAVTFIYSQTAGTPPKP